MTMNTQAKITAIVTRLAEKQADILPDQSLFESGLVDSFTLVDLVSALEIEFAIKIPVAHLSPRKFDSITRIQDYLETRKVA
jgi:acyl carrier protein